MNSAPKGLFITLEGIEAAGKSTQLQLMANRFRALGRTVTVTREPGGTPVGEALRTVLLEQGDTLSPIGQALLVNASRRALLEQCIQPALAAGHVVLCDRFTDSTLAYQQYSLEKTCPQTAAWVRTLNAIASDGELPNKTIILDIPAALAADRLRQRGGATDHFERQGTAFLERLRAAYLHLAALAPARCKVIDGSDTPERVAERVWQALAVT
jgi:dTMP kinase